MDRDAPAFEGEPGQLAVPDGVQRGIRLELPAPDRTHGRLPAVARDAGMQGLVQVPDQVHDPLERLVPLAQRLSRIPQDPAEVLDQRVDAVAVRTRPQRLSADRMWIVMHCDGR